MLRALLAAFALVLSLAAIPARADSGAAPAAEEWQPVVRGQLDAFRQDDAAAAYGYASPGIRATFPSPDIFLGMVRSAYPPVYRPASVAFGTVETGPAGPMAKVYLTDADGNGWVALYSFERQADGTWKISGCRLLKDTAPTI